MKNFSSLLLLIAPLTLVTLGACESSSSNGTPPEDAGAEAGTGGGNRGGSGGTAGSGGASVGGSGGTAGSGAGGTGGSGNTGGSGAGGTGGGGNTGGSGGKGGSGAGGSGGTGAGGMDAGSGGSGAGGVDGSAGASGRGGAGGSGIVDSGPPREAGPDAGPPLLDQPGQDIYACSVTRNPSKLGINPWAAPALLPGDSNVGGYLARVEGMVTSKIVWSTILADGTLGAPKILHDTNPNYVYGLTAAALDDRVTLVWAAGDDARLSLAQIDRAGSIVTAPRPLSSSGMREDQPKLLASGTGYVMAWVQSDGTSATTSQLKFARLDANGAVSGTPVVVAQGAGSLNVASFIALDDGFAIAYSEVGSGTYRPRYVAFDSAGNPYRAVVELGSAGVAGGLLRRGDRVFAAWTENFGNFQQAATGVRVGRFDLRGNLLDSYSLQAPVWHQQSQDPRWITAGEDVGLVWTHGRIHYICAGCVPDNHIRFVILGASDMKRRSEVLDMPPPPATNGGLLDPQAAGPLSNLLLVSSVTYHVSAEGGSAAIACLERDR